MKLEYNENSNVGIAPFGYDPRSKLPMTLNKVYILETGNETFADNCEKIADDYAIEFGQWVSRNDWVYLPIKKYWVNEEEEELEQKLTSKEILKIFKKEKGL
jgi:hypothetical protein